MLKNILATPKIPCSRCGSENTELKGEAGISSLLLNIARLGHLRGQVSVRCRDCGHEALLMVQ